MTRRPVKCDGIVSRQYAPSPRWSFAKIDPCCFMSASPSGHWSARWLCPLKPRPSSWPDGSSPLPAARVGRRSAKEIRREQPSRPEPKLRKHALITKPQLTSPPGKRAGRRCNPTFKPRRNLAATLARLLLERRSLRDALSPALGDSAAPLRARGPGPSAQTTGPGAHATASSAGRAANQDILPPGSRS